MLNRSKTVWTIALTLASAALIVSAGAQAQGKSAGKGKGAEQAQVAWSAPGHVKAKGNGHPNHKGNGYGHGPHEGHDDGDANPVVLPEGCYAASAVVESLSGWDVGSLITTTMDGEKILANYQLIALDASSTAAYITGAGEFVILNYFVSAYDDKDELADSKSYNFDENNEERPTSSSTTLAVGAGSYDVELIVGLCGDLDSAESPE